MPGRRKIQTIKMIWAYIKQLEEGSDEYNKLPKTDRGKINVSKIGDSDIPKEFRTKWFKQNEKKPKNLFTVEEIVEANDNADNTEIRLGAEYRTGRSVMECIDCIGLINRGMTNDSITAHLLTKYGMGVARARRIIKQSRNILALNLKDNKPTIKSDLYQMYSKLLETSVAQGNIKESRNILDSITKLLGANEPEKIEVDNNITINFEE